ncbi:SCP-like extracellular protein [Spironucleus salmonicida]|nr:SCP-like extracellular protein [Spironucleus salmonicida]
MNNRSGEPLLLYFEQIFTIIYDDISDYNVYQITYNTPMLGGNINEFISHPNKDKPIKFELLANMIRLSFTKNAIVNQIQYFGSSLKSQLSNIQAPVFNVLLYYRFQDESLSNWEKESVRLTNEHRVNNSLPPYQFSKKLSWIMRLKSIDMSVNNYFDHNSPYYGGLLTLTLIFGVPNVAKGEIIFRGSGYQTPLSAFMGWKNSPVHNNIMLSQNRFTAVGAGCYVQTDIGTTWTQGMQGFWEGLEATFTYGENLVLKPPYTIEDPTIVKSILLVTGLVFATILTCLGLGCVIAFIVIKRKNGMSM